MIRHPELRLLVVRREKDDYPDPWLRMAGDLPHLRVDWATELPADCSAHDAIFVQGAAMQRVGSDQLLKYTAAGGTSLVLPWGEECRLPDEFGVQPDPPGAET